MYDEVRGQDMLSFREGLLMLGWAWVVLSPWEWPGPDTRRPKVGYKLADLE